MSIFDSDAGATGAGALSGAGTGALIGSSFGPVGTGIGAGAGALLGGISGYLGHHGSSQAADAQRKALDEAMKRLQMFSQQQYANRMADLDKTMSFYGPSQNYLQSIYTKGQGTQANPVATPGPSSAIPPPGGVAGNPFNRLLKG